MPIVNKQFDNFYFAVYTYNDELITVFDTIDNLARFFNRPIFETLRKLRNHSCFEKDKHKFKVYIYPKFELQENYNRKR